ncbi:hypothetical protein LJR129_005077 [Acidovorax sp. LjRoot129]|uniref:hypothetical protein n=1 Tax=unclassified Acidovorax TaxID=2684926 RepID=UPI003ECF2045
MTKISISPPIKVKTRDGLDATIYEIDLDDLQQAIHGTVITPGMGTINKAWSKDGICSNGTDELNIDPDEPGFSSVINKF